MHDAEVERLTLRMFRAILTLVGGVMSCGLGLNKVISPAMHAVSCSLCTSEPRHPRFQDETVRGLSSDKLYGHCVQARDATVFPCR